MKKIIGFLSVLFFGLALIGCGTKTTTIAQTDEEAVAEAEGLIILDVEAQNVLSDFTLTKTVIGNGVSVQWTSSNTELVEIVKETKDGQEYWVAKVTLVPLGGEATVVTLTYTLTKGEATTTGTEKVKIAVDEMLTLAEVRQQTTGAIIKTKGVVTYRNALAKEYNNFSVYLEDENSGLMLYRINGDLYDDFKEGNLVEVMGEVAPYQGLYEIKNVTLLKVHSENNEVDAATDITNLVGKEENIATLENLQSKWVTIKGNFIAKVVADGSKFHLYLMDGSKQVIEVYYHTDNLADLADKAAEVEALNGKLVTEVTGIMGWYSAPQIVCTAYDKVITGEFTDELRVAGDLVGATSLFEAAYAGNVEVTLPAKGANGSDLAWEVVSDDKTVLANGKVVVAQGDAEVVVKLKVTATYNGKSEEATVEFKVAASKPLTLAEAIALCGTTKDVYTEEKYLIGGIVKEVQNATYGNILLTDGTTDLLVYGSYSADGSTRYDKLETQPKVGDYVEVYGILGYYKAPQMKNGWIKEHIVSVTLEEAIELSGTTKDVYTEGKYLISGTVKEVQNATYGNILLTNGTTDLLVYGTYSADGSTRYDKLEAKPEVGATVYVYGILGYYKAPQMKNGWILAFAAAPAQPEQPEQPEQPVDSSKLVIKNYATANSWENSKPYLTINYDENTTVTATGTPTGDYGLNTGKYYESEPGTWRIYQNETPTVTITSTKTIAKVIIEYAIKNDGILVVGETQYASGVEITVNANTFSFSVANTGTKTNGQVQVTAIKVVYTE